MKLIPGAQKCDNSVCTNVFAVNKVDLVAIVSFEVDGICKPLVTFIRRGINNSSVV